MVDRPGNPYSNEIDGILASLGSWRPTLTDWLAPLSPAQRAAATHVDGPLLILAGPGSGKTRTVTYRIAHLLSQGIPSTDILALTFTNKAAEEMQHRLQALEPHQPPWAGTFHKFCARLLRQYARVVGLEANYSIYDTDDSRAVLKRVLAELEIDLLHTPVGHVAHWISQAKNSLVRADDFQPRLGDPLEAIMAKVYPEYQRQLLAANAVDFDDMLSLVAHLLRDHPDIRARLDHRNRYILVDEYQDTNLAQYGIVRALSIDYPNLCATGDPDQSIYAWRGATIRNILEFERDFPQTKVVRLEQNYRSTKCILRVADTLIRHNKRRKEKALFTDNAEGSPVRLSIYASESAEALAIAERIADEVHRGQRKASDFAVFYRVNALSAKLELALKQKRVPYQVVQGFEFFQRAEVRDVIAYLLLLNNPRDDVAFLRVANRPTRGIGQKTLDQIRGLARMKGLSLFDAARASSASGGGLSNRAAKCVRDFVAIIDQLAAHLFEPVEAIVGRTLKETGYKDALQSSTAPEDLDRLANLEEILSLARDFDEAEGGPGKLEAFLEMVRLASDTDAFEGDVERVTLMTLHAAKGLEFPVVSIIAVEEGLLPHARSKERDEDLEEERRLFFVGITRAKEELWLSQAQYREFRGQRRMTVPSPFLMELPRDDLERHEFGTRLRYDEYRQEESPDDFGDMEFADDEAGTFARARGSAKASREFDEEDYDRSEAAADNVSDDDLDFDPDKLEQPVRRLSSAAAKPAKPPREFSLITAADLAAAGSPTSKTVEQFRQDMLVTHPVYGVGRILALSGNGIKRTATVRFVRENRERKFVLALSPLVPVKSEE